MRADGPARAFVLSRFQSSLVGEDECEGAVKDGQVRMEQVKERGEPTYPYDIKTISGGDTLSFQVISTVVGPKTDEQRDVLKWLDRRPGAGRRAAEVARALNMPIHTAQRVLSELVQLNLVHRDEDHGARGGRSFVYRTPTLDDNDELGVASA